MKIDKGLLPDSHLLLVLAVTEVVCIKENVSSGMLLIVFTLQVTPEGRAPLLGVQPRPLKSLPNKDAPTGHWEYDFSCIPYLNTPEGPAFVRQPLEAERQWVGDSSPPRDERPVEEPPRQRSEDLWSAPPEWRNTFLGMSPRVER